MSPNRTIALASAAAMALVGIDVGFILRSYNEGAMVAPLIQKVFSAEYEHNVPAVYSAVLALWCTVLLVRISMSPQGQTARKRWVFLAIICGFLALDELLALHEYLPSISGGIYSWADKTVWDHVTDVAWLTPYAAALVACVFFGSFVLKWPPRTRNLTILAASIFLSGAIILETAGFALHRVGLEHADLLVELLGSMEEGLEMAGIIVFGYALMLYSSHAPSSRALKEERSC